MKLRRLFGAIVATAALTTAGFVAGTQTSAAADWSPQSQALCSNTSHCGIGFPVGGTLDGRTQGVPFTVNVTGRKDHTVRIRAYAVKWNEAGTDFTFAPVSSVVSVKLVDGTSSYGFANPKITVDLPPAGYTGVQITVQTEDFKKGHAFVGQHWTGQESQPGAFTEVKTYRGYDKGFAQAQFSNGVFHRSVNAAYPGDRYTVEMLRGGKWVNIEDPTASKAIASNSGIAVVQGKVPADLPQGTYRTRLVNVTRNITDVTADQKWAYFTWTRTPRPGDKDFDVYTTPGTWEVNGRNWKTSCENYSTTERCRTEIWATQIVNQGGRYVQTNGWVFNNLTYKPIARSAYKNNPIGGYGQVGYDKNWTSDGRQWRTECDTAATGRGGCRSYIMATVIEVNPAGGYRSVNKWLFNNIVRFSS